MDIFLIFFYMKVCCVFSLESPQRGDSNEYTQRIIFNIKKKIILIYPKYAAMGCCSKGLKNEFETAIIVNEPSVFEPLKFYCISEMARRLVVGCFVFNGPFRQYFSLYRAVPQRKGERREK